MPVSQNWTHPRGYKRTWPWKVSSYSKCFYNRSMVTIGGIYTNRLCVWIMKSLYLVSTVAFISLPLCTIIKIFMCVRPRVSRKLIKTAIFRAIFGPDKIYHNISFTFQKLCIKRMTIQTINHSNKTVRRYLNVIKAIVKMHNESIMII